MFFIPGTPVIFMIFPYFSCRALWQLMSLKWLRSP
jgi:hypothetical protein